MDTDDQVYRDLQKWLERLPSGYSPTESGSDIRILKHWYTPEEAKLAMQLSMRLEPLKRIYNRVKKSGMSIEELEKLLDQMIYKGTVIVREEGYAERHYCNAGFGMGGTADFWVNRFTEDMFKDMLQYAVESGLMDEPRPKELPLLRTIPVGKSIPLLEKFQVSNYDKVNYIIENTSGPIAVTKCICRDLKDRIGEPCKVTDLRETCLMIGSDHAKNHVAMGIGRYISKEEALEILRKAQGAGLVIQPENSLRPDAICCCCGDCCVQLTAVKKLPRPADLYASNYYAEVDPELCNACGKCVEKCQMEAQTIVDNVATVNLDRCIGCGNCVTVCDTNACYLKQKEKELLPPKDKEASYMKVMFKRGGTWDNLMLRMKTLLRLKV
jgi:electron transport complex protein RnfB